VSVELDDLMVEYVDEDGQLRWGPLEVVWPARFEAGAPVRRIASYRGQRNFTGWYWAVTGAVHVGYESWLERDHLMRLDQDTSVAAVASQPFRLSWPGNGKRGVSHTPDFFVRRVDGSALVVDVRPDERIEPADAEKFEVTAWACRQVGWDFERVGALDEVFLANLRWLAGYRHPRLLKEPVAQRLRAGFTQERGLMDGVREVGDPVTVLPVLFHLAWCQQLSVDLKGALLSGASMVGPGSAEEVNRIAGASARAASG
jgi:hypothetical protein